MPPDGEVDRELVRLRDWRHEVVTPALAANREQLKRHEQRLAEMEPQLARMAKADEIADAVTEHMQAARRGLLTTGEKIGGVLVGLAAVASVIVQLLGH